MYVCVHAFVCVCSSCIKEVINLANKLYAYNHTSTLKHNFAAKFSSQLLAVFTLAQAQTPTTTTVLYAKTFPFCLPKSILFCLQLLIQVI